MSELFVPGRVNLLGEHIDYNGGRVLPTALPLGVTLSMTPRADGTLSVRSDAFKDIAKRKIGEGAAGHWSDYILGAATLLESEGADFRVATTLPFGAGISSSAAITVGAIKALAPDMPDVEAAVLARRVENEFIGMPCGIMDQMAVAVARPGQVLSLDTDSLDFELIDLPEQATVAVVHSGVHRLLNEGRYAVRKEECDAVKRAAGRKDICKMSDEELAQLASLPGPLFARARHCVTEHRRSEEGADALKAGDTAKFGALMLASHASMRDDFEITVPAIDAMVETAAQAGALGARMTGGGFGGCIVALLPQTLDRNHWLDELLAKHPDGHLVCWI